jgi:predicted small secreted protein
MTRTTARRASADSLWGACDNRALDWRMASANAGRSIGQSDLIEGLMMKRVFYVLAAFVAAISFASLTACNTIQGVGKDIEKGGQAINKAAK